MIRPASRADLRRVLEIRTGAGENPLSDPATLTDRDALRLIEQGALLLWEEADGVVSGLAAVDVGDGSFRALLVAPGHEGQGIGRALLKAGCDMLSGAGHRSATLRARPGGAVEEHYRRDGWTGDGIDEFGRLILQKPL